ncbi:hypothetical protein Goklo_005804 [Gossypium klotzschianum]|uniref:Cytochrome P450 n=1 Tax=Gossypium klotzschianum TaxID=34286 RepID=A0A7J8VFE8_9ROSI|nr:hypothetical protein [Gossypium klotzschianum]
MGIGAAEMMFRCVFQGSISMQDCLMELPMCTALHNLKGICLSTCTSRTTNISFPKKQPRVIVPCLCQLPDSLLIFLILVPALILAAEDTTSITMTWALSLLLNNRDALNQVEQELDIHVGNNRLLVKESDIKNLVYLQSVIKETLRLYPTAPLSVMHESIEDCTINGYHVSTGTWLIINLQKIHRDPFIWENPFKFRPKRFMTTHKNIDVRGHNFELIPFGSGRRMCPGVSFALQIMQLTLANLLHWFKFETPLNEAVDMREAAGMTSPKATPLEVHITPHLPTFVYDSNN